MPDIKQDIVNAVNSVEQKAAVVDIEAQKAKQAVLSKLNQTESWVSRHPGITILLGSLTMLALAFSLIAAFT